MEAGYETVPDAGKAYLYTGRETSSALPDLVAGAPWTELPPAAEPGAGPGDAAARRRSPGLLPAVRRRLLQLPAPRPGRPRVLAVRRPLGRPDAQRLLRCVPRRDPRGGGGTVDCSKYPVTPAAPAAGAPQRRRRRAAVPAPAPPTWGPDWAPSGRARPAGHTKAWLRVTWFPRAQAHVPAAERLLACLRFGRTRAPDSWPRSSAGTGGGGSPRPARFTPAASRRSASRAAAWRTACIARSCASRAQAPCGCVAAPSPCADGTAAARRLAQATAVGGSSARFLRVSAQPGHGRPPARFARARVTVRQCTRQGPHRQGTHTAGRRERSTR